MRHGTHEHQGARRAALLALVLATAPAQAQDRVSIEQVQIAVPRATVTAPRGAIQESDYILGGQAGGGLFNPSVPTAATVPGASQARVTQIGTGNVSNVDMSGYSNTAIQSILGSQNTVTQQQTGVRNQSTVSVVGDSNTIGTRQDGFGAAATITVRGDNNAISAQQQGFLPLPVSITQVGNGANVSVTRR